MSLDDFGQETWPHVVHDIFCSGVNPLEVYFTHCRSFLDLFTVERVPKRLQSLNKLDSIRTYASVQIRDRAFDLYLQVI